MSTCLNINSAPCQQTRRTSQQFDYMFTVFFMIEYKLYLMPNLLSYVLTRMIRKTWKVFNHLIKQNGAHCWNQWQFVWYLLTSCCIFLCSWRFSSHVHAHSRFFSLLCSEIWIHFHCVGNSVGSVGIFQSLTIRFFFIASKI